ncbi:MAG: cupin domain-containing protein [Myxococcales bacterium]|nr:cupin domain-containing protein [Myxococcales bacterium]MBL0198167.1 cupin domain-containing protein [Myxococcales bacterium]HQY60836.1 cupin domain-containing protein [Polyangiaceae bacterium]
MPLTPPALDPSTLTPRTHSTYPEVYRERVLPREKRGLGAALGLTKLGVNLTTLAPGKQSALRHFHTREDELVYVVEGEVTLVTDGGEQTLGAGMCAGFPAGVRDGHHLVNRTGSSVRYLEMSSRDPDDGAEYPDDDLAYSRGPDGPVFTRKDGSPTR